MVKKRGNEVQREILVGLLLVIIFLTLVGTWTVLEALDTYTGAVVDYQTVYEKGIPDEGGAKIGITIQPQESGG